MDLRGPLSLLRNVTTDLEVRFRQEVQKSKIPIQKFIPLPNVTSIWDDESLQSMYAGPALEGAVATLSLLEMFYRIYNQLSDLLLSVPEKYNIHESSLLHSRVKRSLENDFTFDDDPIFMKCFSPYTNTSHRTKREILGGAALGISLWNSYRLSNIESHLKNLSSKYNLLVDSVSLLSSQHNQLAADVEIMKRLIHLYATNSQKKIMAASMSTADQLRDTVDNVVSIVTSGRQRRVSPRLINGDSLAELFVSLQKKAKELNSELLLQHPSDIYDVQASYGYSQSGLFFKIYAHVPLASKTETLALFEHIPFPLVFQSMAANLTITPNPGSDRYLAVLPSDVSPDGHKYRVLNEAELKDCFQLRDYYLCSGRNILRLDMGSSCIGSLWMQNHSLVVQNCNMLIEPLQEVAVKTSPRQWLVFSPKVFSVSANCGKNVVQSLRFEPQTMITLIEDCEINLQRHILSSDVNILFDFKVETYEWRYFGSLFTPPSSPEDINSIINQIVNSKDKYGLQDLGYLKHNFEAPTDHLSQLWKSISELNLFAWFGNVYMFIFYVLILWLCFHLFITRGWLRKCCCPKKEEFSRDDSSIIRPVKTSSVRYTMPPLSKPLVKSGKSISITARPLKPLPSPPPYNSIVIDNPPSAPITRDNETSLYPTLAPLMGESSSQCFIKYSNEAHDPKDFICHHHDPIHGCNGSFTKS